MKITHYALIICLGFGCLHADDFFIIRQDRFIRINPIYQNWSLSGSNHIAEFSAPVFLYVPFGYHLSFDLQTSPAMVSGNPYSKLQGMTDVQAGVSYHLESLNSVLNVGVNIPSGQKELTAQEFETSHLISLYHFDLRTPNFGQGLNLSTGLSWARPFSPRFVLGLGAAYQYRGPYKPIQGMVFNYDPGDEIALTSGFDYKANETTSLSLDLTFTSYKMDMIDKEKAFGSGNKIVANFKYDKYFAFDELLLMVRYRSKDKNRVAIAGQFLKEEEKSLPNHFEVRGLYKHRYSPLWNMGFFMEGRFIQKTAIYSSMNIYGIGLMPEYTLHANMSLLGHFKSLFAQTNVGRDYFGLEIGVGMEARF
jgi:hypothetical protein